LIDENFPDSIIVCAGTRVDLNPEFNENYIYSWSPSEIFGDASNPNQSVLINDAQQFTVQVRNEFDCVLNDSIFTDAAPFIEINTQKILSG